MRLSAPRCSSWERMFAYLCGYLALHLPGEHGSNVDGSLVNFTCQLPSPIVTSIGVTGVIVHCVLYGYLW